MLTIFRLENELEAISLPVKIQCFKVNVNDHDLINKRIEFLLSEEESIPR